MVVGSVVGVVVMLVSELPTGRKSFTVSPFLAVAPPMGSCSTMVSISPSRSSLVSVRGLSPTRLISATASFTSKPTTDGTVTGSAFSLSSPPRGLIRAMAATAARRSSTSAPTRRRP